MSAELESALYEYLGELMHKEQNEFDWIEKSKITRKMNACYILLGIDKKLDSTMERIIKYVKTEL